jgi:hypothetical protein
MNNSVNGSTCNKCGAKNITIVGVSTKNMHKCHSQTPDKKSFYCFTCEAHISEDNHDINWHMINVHKVPTIPKHKDYLDGIKHALKDLMEVANMKELEDLRREVTYYAVANNIDLL